MTTRKEVYLNEDTAWSEMDEYDLRYAVEHNRTLEETATFTQRSPQELVLKAAARGLRFKKLLAPV